MDIPLKFVDEKYS